MSLRARLLLSAALIALVLGVAAVAITRATRAHLIDQVDAQLSSGVQQVGERPGGFGDPRNDEGAPPLSRYYVGVLTADGELVAVPRLTNPEAPTPRLDDGAIDALEVGQIVTVPSDDPKVDYRMRQGVELRDGRTTVIALPLDDVDEAVRRLVAVEAAAVLAVLGVLALVMWWVIRLGVRPVQRMTETASAIAAGDLSQRVPEGAPGTEAGDLGVALNGMLGRIEDAFDQRTESEARLRQFVADASHELRTPVATIRGYAELYRAGALAQTAELDDAMRRTEQEAVRMGSLVDDLLHLARLDQGRPLERAPVDLVSLVQDAAQDAQAVAPDRTIDVVTRGAVVVHGRPRPSPPGRGEPRRQRARACARRSDRDPRSNRGQRGRHRGGGRGPGHGRRGRGAGVRALLPGRRLPKPAPRRQRARALDRGGDDPSPRRSHVDHHRAGGGDDRPGGAAGRGGAPDARRRQLPSSRILASRAIRALIRRVSVASRRGGSSPRWSR